MQLFSVMVLRQKLIFLVSVLNVKIIISYLITFHTQILQILKYGRVMTTKKL